MADKDLYAILGVGKNATPDEMKTAFRAKAKEIHPDKFQDEKEKKVAEEKFKELGEAYSILSDSQKKLRYDQLGYDGMKGMGGGGGQGYSGFSPDMEDVFGDISDIFGDFFGFDSGARGRRGGSSRGSRRRRSGDDLRYDAVLSFEDIAAGKKEIIEINRKEACDTCKGEGIKPGTSRITCKTCGGAGKVRQSSGFFSVVTTCPACGGSGETAEANCPDCGGSGVKTKKRKIEVKIPAGVDAGSYLKLSGEGHAGMNGGANGDLYVVINLKPHEIYKRDGDNVIFELPVTMTQAVLGDDIVIPTLYGDHNLKIQPGTQGGDILEIRGKGFPRPHSQAKGDMKVVISVEIPRNINSKLKDAFKNVKVLESEDNYGAVRNASKTFKKYKKEVD
jgi:molecular chaperone DnaJ